MLLDYSINSINYAQSPFLSVRLPKLPGCCWKRKHICKYFSSFLIFPYFVKENICFFCSHFFGQKCVFCFRRQAKKPFIPEVQHAQQKQQAAAGNSLCPCLCFFWSPPDAASVLQAMLQQDAARYNFEIEYLSTLSDKCFRYDQCSINLFDRQTNLSETFCLKCDVSEFLSSWIWSELTFTIAKICRYLLS